MTLEVSGGDPGVVARQTAHAASQAGLNGPSGSPTSPPERASRGGRPRVHNWTTMQTLRNAGWSYSRIGRLLGVNHTVVMYACDPDFRARKRAKARAATHG